MRNSFRILVTTFAVALIASAVANAQPMAPQGPVAPGVSPYLNLLRNQNNNLNPALNYLTITRPQVQLAQQANQLNQQIQMTNQQLMQQQNAGGVMGADPILPITGRRTYYGNLGGHFNSYGGGGMGGGGAIGGGMRIGQGFAAGANMGAGTRAPMAAGAGAGARRR